MIVDNVSETVEPEIQRKDTSMTILTDNEVEEVEIVNDVELANQLEFLHEE